MRGAGLFVGLACVVASACGPGGTPHPGTTAPASPVTATTPAPAEGCAGWIARHPDAETSSADGPQRGEAGTLRDMDEVSLAIRAGCYRRALTLARAALERTDERDSGRRFVLQLLLVRAAQASLEGALVRRGPILSAHAGSPMGRRAALPDLAAEHIALQRAASQVTSEPPEPLAFDASDFVATLLAPSSQDCALPDTILTPAMRAATHAAMDRVVESIPLSGPSALAVEHVHAQMACRPGDARQAALRLVDHYAGVGEPAAAYAWRIRAVEAEFFTTGRLDDLELSDPSGGDVASLIAREVSLASRTFAASAQAALSALAAARPHDLDAATHAEARLLEAAITLRFVGDAPGALALSREAWRAADEAQRFAERDAAAALSVFALAAQGDFGAASQELVRLRASLDERGALGAALQLEDRLMTRGALHRDAGELDEAVGWLRLGETLYPYLPVAMEVGRRSTLATLISMTHRHEEALDLLDAAERILRERRDEADPREFEQQLTFTRAFRLQIGARLGRVAEEELDQQSFDPSGQLPRALREGDLPSLRRAIEGDRLFPAQLGALMPLGFCHAMRARSERLTAEAQDTARLREATRDALDALSQRADISPQERSAAMLALHGQFVGADPRIHWLGQQQAMCALVTSDGALLRQSRETLASAEHPRANDITSAVAERVLSGDFVGAAERLERAAGESLQTSGLAEASAVSAFEGAASFLEAAAAVRLRGPEPDIQAVVRDLELARARALRGSRATRTTTGGATGPLLTAEAAVERAQTRARVLAQLVERASDDARGPLEAALEGAVAEISRLDEERARVVRALQQDHPEAYRAAALADPPSLALVRQRLRDDETLLYLKVDAEHAWGVLVDGTQARAVTLGARDERGMPALSMLFARFRHLLDRQSGLARGLVLVNLDADARRVEDRRIQSELNAVRAELDQRVVQPLLPYLPVGRRVIVIPDATTGGVPLGAIGVGPSTWIRRNPLRYLPGAHQLTAPRAQRPPLTPAFVLGDPALGSQAQAQSRGGARHVLASAVPWRQLPGARSEAQAVARLLGTAPIVGERASETSARRGLVEARLIHLATHGLANSARPDFSALVFSLPEAGSEHDGILHAYEVEQLNVNAELVVLSACETGRGQTRGSEGVMAIDRAFLVAGAEAVVSSFWPVEDEATALFMRAFYQALGSGQSADVALSGAMVALANEPRFEDPYFWAAFRLVGSGLR